MSTKNLRNAFDVNDIPSPDEDPEIQELVALKTIKSAISKKKRNLKQKAFEKNHPALVMLQNEIERKKKMEEAKELDRANRKPLQLRLRGTKDKEQEPEPEPTPAPNPEPTPQSEPAPSPEPPMPKPVPKDPLANWDKRKLTSTTAVPRGIKKVSRSGEWF